MKFERTLEALFMSKQLRPLGDCCWDSMAADPASGQTKAIRLVAHRKADGSSAFVLVYGDLGNPSKPEALSNGVVAQALGSGEPLLANVLAQLGRTAEAAAALRPSGDGRFVMEACSLGVVTAQVVREKIDADWTYRLHLKAGRERHPSVPIDAGFVADAVVAGASVLRAALLANEPMAKAIGAVSAELKAAYDADVLAATTGARADLKSGGASRL